MYRYIPYHGNMFFESSSKPSKRRLTSCTYIGICIVIAFNDKNILRICIYKLYKYSTVHISSTYPSIMYSTMNLFDGSFCRFLVVVCWVYSPGQPTWEDLSNGILHDKIVWNPKVYSPKSSTYGSPENGIPPPKKKKKSRIFFFRKPFIF